jgi:hypothetical protein
VLPQQASRQSPTDGTSSAACARRFPQHVWTTPCSTHWRVLGPSHRGLPSERRRAPLAGAASRWRRAVAGGWGSRPSGVPETSGRAAVSRSVSTALRRQGRVVARATGPRHRRPRLRHEAHRRGEASAASGPLKARARVVTKVHLSAQPPADRSVRRLIPRRRWTAPADRWAARRLLPAPRRLGNALEQTLRLASPRRPPGDHAEGTGAAALCPCHCFLPPLSPL